MKRISKRHLVRLLVCAAALLGMAVYGFAAQAVPAVTHGPTFPPDPWDGLTVAHGPTFPPDPWDGLTA